MNKTEAAICSELNKAIDKRQYVETLSRINELLPAAENPRFKAHLLAVVARSELKQKRPDQAALYYRQAIQLDPSYLQAHLALVKLAAAAGNKDEALRNTEASIKILSKTQTAYDQKIKAATQLAPGESLILDPSPENSDRFLRKAGNALAQYGYTAEAKALLTPAANPKDTESSQALLTLAKIAENEGKPEEAISLLTAILQNPEASGAKAAAIEPYFRITSKLGGKVDIGALRQLAQKENAQIALLQALRSRNRPEWKDLANLILQDNTPSLLQRETAKLVISDNTTNNETKYQLAKALISLWPEDKNSILFAAKALVKLNPSSSTLKEARQTFLEKFGADKISEFDQAIGTALAQNGQTKEALAAFTALAASLPKDSEAFRKATWKAATTAQAAKEPVQAAEFYSTLFSTPGPARFRIQALIEWTKVLPEDQTPAAKEHASKKIADVMSSVTDPTVLLDTARQLRTNTKGFEEQAQDLFLQGKKLAAQDILTDPNPKSALNRAFELIRRQNDMQDDLGIITLWEKNLKAFQASWEKLPGYADLVYYLGTAYWNTGKEETAKNLFDNTKENPCTSPAGRSTLLAQEANLLAQSQRIQEALPLFKAATLESPKNPQIARAYYWLSLQAIFEKNLPQAEKLTESMLSALGNNSGYLWQQELRKKALVLKNLCGNTTEPADPEITAKVKSDLNNLQNRTRFSFFRRPFKKTQAAFTMVEMVITVAIIAIIIGLATVAYQATMRNARDTQADANIKTLNDAATRGRLAFMQGAGVTGTDRQAAVDWYLANQLITTNEGFDITPLYVINGYWGKTSLTDDPSTWLEKITNGEYGEQEILQVLSRFGETHGGVLEAIVQSPNLTGNAAQALAEMLAGAANGSNPIAGLSPTGAADLLVQLAANPAGKDVSVSYAGIDFSTTNSGDLSQVDWTNTDLSNTSMDKRWLDNTDFSNSNLTNATLTNSDLGGANFTGAILSNANLSNSDLGGANFTGANIAGADLSNSSLGNSNLTTDQIESAGNLAGTKFGPEANLNGINLGGRNLTGTVFYGDIEGADLSNTTLTNARFGGSIEGVNLTGATLNNVILGRNSSEQFVYYNSSTGKAGFTAAMNQVTVGARGTPSKWIDGSTF